MKKILFITTRNPYSTRFSGDVIRSYKIIEVLRKKHKLDVLYLGNKKHQNSNFNFNYPNFFLKIIFCLISLLKIQPIQFGLFYSYKMKGYINKNANKYDVIFFYHIRSAQYYPENFKGKAIIEGNTKFIGAELMSSD